MSERHRLESSIRQAAFNLERVEAELQHAMDYMDDHPFLKKSNVGLRSDLEACKFKREKLEGIRVRS